MAKKKKEKKSKTLTRIVTLLIGLGFVGSTVAIAVGSFFSQNNRSAADADNLETAPSIEEQIQLQARGYEKVLEREPKNLTALNGLAQIYLQTGQPEKAIPTLEKLVEFYPEQPQYAAILQAIKERQNSQESTPPSQAKEIE